MGRARGKSREVILKMRYRSQSLKTLIYVANAGVTRRDSRRDGREQIMIRSRPSFQLLNFPFWVLVLFYLIAIRQKTIDENDLAVRLNLLHELYYSLPVPTNWLERFFVTILIQWIHRAEAPATESYWNFDNLNT